jgi:hypothetical protein
MTDTSGSAFIIVTNTAIIVALIYFLSIPAVATWLYWFKRYRKFIEKK